jgi:tetratricopeptide (TPR) repeat protein
VFDEPAREGLYFALGKVLDDAGQYDEAFKAYTAANELCKQRAPGYDRAAVEQAIDELISLFDRNWIEQAQTVCTAAPVFICGMFRSGSTLTEQILAAHPSMQKGDELDILPWLIKRRLAPFPERLRGISAQELEQVAAEYLSKLNDLFPGGEAITDKRPGNFLYLGLIRAMFPSARIVYTKRNLRDNCLSVYFQHLGSNFIYATDLTDIAHYYYQQERLMEHWRVCLGDNVFTVDYDKLVREPEPVLRALLAFLGLEWDDRCLDFHQAESLVKTASIWQVRDPLYTKSSGRWRNYEAHIRDIEALHQET